MTMGRAFWFVTRHPNGGYTTLCGDRDSETIPKARASDKQFESMWDAFDYASEDSPVRVNIDRTL